MIMPPTTTMASGCCVWAHGFNPGEFSGWGPRGAEGQSGGEEAQDGGHHHRPDSIGGAMQNGFRKRQPLSWRARRPITASRPRAGHGDHLVIFRRIGLHLETIDASDREQVDRVVGHVFIRADVAFDNGAVAGAINSKRTQRFSLSASRCLPGSDFGLVIDFLDLGFGYIPSPQGTLRTLFGVAIADHIAPRLIQRVLRQTPLLVKVFPRFEPLLVEQFIVSSDLLLLRPRGPPREWRRAVCWRPLRSQRNLHDC